MRLPRPHIPVSVRAAVAVRQLRLISPVAIDIDLTQSAGTILKGILFVLFGEEKVHLDHDPPLGARRKIMRGGEIVGYIPDANDPDYLFYRTATLHRIKTNVRGEHGQHPDRVLIKKQRRLERGIKQKPKTKWPKRKLQSASRWPQGRTLRGKSSWPKRRLRQS